MKDKTILVTGANRGIGQALVEEALKRGAGRVYAAARKPLQHNDARVTPLLLDITNESHIQAAAASVGSLDILINNAGVSIFDNLSDRATIEEHLKVNLFGPHAMMHAFVPHLVRSHGSIVNILSVAAFVGLPIVPGYSISKAAAFSLSQNMRALLASRGVKVQIVLPGPIDTEMSKAFEVPKATPQATAVEIFDGIKKGDEEIFPDPMSASLQEYWNLGAFKELERQYAGLVS
jgi:NAD(P)-dependent dehydrogenase (short-subunit alcohol dehydrogenase family)